MRWLMVSQSTADQAVGGTEQYVRRLSECLLARGVEVAWVHYDTENADLEVRESAAGRIRYSQIHVRQAADRREQGWRIDPVGLDEFKAVLRDVQPEVVHFHGFGRSQSPEHFEAAKQSGARVLMTYHAPGQSCSRWDLLYKGGEMCSGAIDVSRCTDCALHRAGVPAPLRLPLSRMDFSGLAQILPYSVQHPLVRRKGLIDYRRRWKQGMAMPDKILWHANWVRDILLRNGVSEHRLHWLPLPPPSEPTVAAQPGTRDPMVRRFVYFGRLSDIKGVHILIDAVGLLPPIPKFEVLIFGAKGREEYFNEIQRACAKDARIRLMPPVDAEHVPALMRTADAVIVPSLWPETGPYTVLEALWAGTPVVGTDRAGIRELIDRWGGGVLFEPGNVKQLAKVLSDCHFTAMRRAPDEFRAAWLNGFERALEGLVAAQSRSTPVMSHA
jgi:glycosyltransferase involved in cell wall biosynthesis